jgi:hypothetical protein
MYFDRQIKHIGNAGIRSTSNCLDVSAACFKQGGVPVDRALANHHAGQVGNALMIVALLETNWRFDPRFCMRSVIRNQLALQAAKWGYADKPPFSKGRRSGAHVSSIRLPGPQVNVQMLEMDADTDMGTAQRPRHDKFWSNSRAGISHSLQSY